MDCDLRAWLIDLDSSPQQLFTWLSGIGVPRREGEETFSVLLRALPLGATHFEAEKLLAGRLAEIMQGEPEKTCFGNGKNQILYNLLMLCSGIPFHEVLWEPLCSLHRRAGLEGTLAADWLHVPLGSALRTALISQQADPRFKQTWFDTIEEKPDPLLRGLPTDGMEGIRLLPARNKDGQRTDYIKDVGKGLKLLANYLEQLGDNKKKIFRLWVDRVTVTQPERLWCYEILKQADSERWPAWAAACLSLYFVIDTLDDGWRRVCIWNRMLHIVLEPDEYVVEQELLRHFDEDKAVIVKVSPVVYHKFLRGIAPELDYFRRTHDYPSPRWVVEELIHGLNYVVSGLSDTDEAKARLENGHKRVLAQENLSQGQPPSS